MSRSKQSPGFCAQGTRKRVLPFGNYELDSKERDLGFFSLFTSADGGKIFKDDFIS